MIAAAGSDQRAVPNSTALEPPRGNAGTFAPCVNRHYLKRRRFFRYALPCPAHICGANGVEPWAFIRDLKLTSVNFYRGGLFLSPIIY